MLTQAPATDATLDAGATMCGDLIVMIAQHMKGLAPNQVLHIIAYDRGATQDVPAWCRMTQNTLVYQQVATDTTQPSHFYIQKGT